MATGKTTVADIFVEKGAIKIDADKLAHQILRDSDKIKEEVVGLFGEGILSDGEIDRRKLADKVFSDKNELDKLCNLLHPEIIKRIKEEINKNEDSIIIVDAPLLIETGLHEIMDLVIVVNARKDLQVKRATDRGITTEEAENIIQNQMPFEEKKKFADYVIDNDGNINVIKEGVERIWQKK